MVFPHPNELDKYRQRGGGRHKAKGADPDAPYKRLIDIINDVYQEVQLPVWVVRKVLKAFFASIMKRMLRGEYLNFPKLGDFYPQRHRIGTTWKDPDAPYVSAISYKLRMAPTFKRRVREATRREGVPNVQKGKGASNPDV